MKKFRLEGGNHVQDGKTYVPGQIVESKHPLDELFPNKFTLVQEVVVRAIKEEPADELPEQPPKRAKAFEPPDGEEDVTAKFTAAEDRGWHVTKVGKKFNVYGKSNQVVKKGLKNAIELVEFLEEYAENDTVDSEE